MRYKLEYCIQLPNFRKDLSTDTSWRRHRLANSSSLVLQSQFVTSSPRTFEFRFQKMAVYIKKSKQLLDAEQTPLILAINAFCGCHTTLRLYSVGSCTILQNVLKNQSQNLLRTFSVSPLDRKDILQTGEKMLLLLLGGKRDKTLDELHVHK